MPNSATLTCIDCLEPFCTQCDDSTHCPDCHGAMCEDCSAVALDERRSRCYTCHDPSCADTQFNYPGGRELYKNYANPVKGKLPCL